MYFSVSAIRESVFTCAFVHLGKRTYSFPFPRTARSRDCTLRCCCSHYRQFSEIVFVVVSFVVPSPHGRPQAPVKVWTCLRVLKLRAFSWKISFKWRRVSLALHRSTVARTTRLGEGGPGRHRLYCRRWWWCCWCCFCWSTRVARVDAAIGAQKPGQRRSEFFVSC